MRRRWEDRVQRVEVLAQAFLHAPLQAAYRPRLRGGQPSPVWRLFPRQSPAMGFMQACQEDVHVFALEKDTAAQGQRIYLVTSYSELWHYYRTFQHSLMHCYEVIPEGAVCKLYFDLEFHRPSNPGLDGTALVAFLIQYVCEQLVDVYGVACTARSVLNLDSSTEDKFSRHLIFCLDSAAFKDNLHMGRSRVNSSVPFSVQTLSVMQRVTSDRGDIQYRAEPSRQKELQPLAGAQWLGCWTPSRKVPGSVPSVPKDAGFSPKRPERCRVQSQASRKMPGSVPSVPKGAGFSPKRPERCRVQSQASRKMPGSVPSVPKGAGFSPKRPERCRVQSQASRKVSGSVPSVPKDAGFSPKRPERCRVQSQASRKMPGSVPSVPKGVGFSPKRPERCRVQSQASRKMPGSVPSVLKGAGSPRLSAESCVGEGETAHGPTAKRQKPGQTRDHSDLSCLKVKGKQGQECLFVDLGVYTKNRNFRLYKSSKVGKNVALTVAEDNQFTPTPLKNFSPEQSLFLASLVCNVSYTGQRILTWDVPDGTSTRTNTHHAEEAPGDTLTGTLGGSTSSPYKEVDDFVLTVIQKAGIQGCIRRWSYFVGEQLLVYDILKYRWCENVGRFHKSNNIMILVDLKEEIWYQKCHDPACRTFRSSSYPLPKEICVSYLMKMDEEEEEEEERYIMDAAGNIGLREAPGTAPDTAAPQPDTVLADWADEADDRAYVEALEDFEKSTEFSEAASESDRALLELMTDFESQKDLN
ncbi:DNA-directed primase/polymerase protein [Merluccius polli]|uniref:DNA-directed primase/polymerase protein n=1 Tax=Merluccius polli TaxID=89951 RepID=A0AA47NZG5_MERPO|nr:DNA-directed primase/polymerase protein [Merluccius polli]